MTIDDIRHALENTPPTTIMNRAVRASLREMLSRLIAEQKKVANENESDI